MASPRLARTAQVPRQLPWRRPTNSKRLSEDVRPIHWSNRPKSYLSRTADWDSFPSGRCAPGSLASPRGVKQAAAAQGAPAAGLAAQACCCCCCCCCSSCCRSGAGQLRGPGGRLPAGLQSMPCKSSTSVTGLCAHHAAGARVISCHEPAPYTCAAARGLHQAPATQGEWEHHSCVRCAGGATAGAQRTAR